MNRKRLLQLGVPEPCIASAQQCLRDAAASKRLRQIHPKRLIPKVVADPQQFVTHDVFGDLASAIIEFRNQPPLPDPIAFRQWGDDIDPGAIEQIQNACALPMARAAALMPDAHLGYGMPIGGVVACEGAVIPYAVGVDIACRMRLTLTDLDPTVLDQNDPIACQSLDRSLEQGTLFGAGKSWKSESQRPSDHAVMDEDWAVTAVTRKVRDRAWQQLGTSGSGNHFVEWGLVDLPAGELGLEAGRYVGLLSHSGSRGAGATVCRHYTNLATKYLPYPYQNDQRMNHLAWLALDSQEGQEYWLAMNLMGRYAAANHEVIHRRVTRLAGARDLATVENHHNFAWKEQLGGRELIVHRKGATPAHLGTLGVIPGSMASPAYIVRGKGVAASVHSASHGAGRRMSRTAAKRAFRWDMWKQHLANYNVRVLASSLDEVPGAYKDIDAVMAAQADLVDIVGQFSPRIVMMCSDSDRMESNLRRRRS